MTGPRVRCPDTSAALDLLESKREGGGDGGSVQVAARNGDASVKGPLSGMDPSADAAASVPRLKGQALCQGIARTERWCLSLPRVFCVCLAWPQSPSVADISTTMGAISQVS
jgi:hypothetical protein